MWELNEAIEVYRWFETALSAINYHCGLTGSVLYKGESSKDLDLIIYPHKSLDYSRTPLEIMYYLFIKKPKLRNHLKNGDSKIVYSVVYNGKRIDLFFLQ